MPTFVLNQPCGLEEDRHTEFKRVRAVGDLEPRVMQEYAVGFLNAEGGSVFYGVRDNGLVEGMNLSTQDKDQFKRRFFDSLRAIRGAPAPIECFSIDFHPVHIDCGEDIDDTYVVETCTPQGSPAELYWTGRAEVYLKLDAVNQKLTPEQIRAELGRRDQLREAEGGPPMPGPPAPEGEMREHWIRYCQYLVRNHKHWTGMPDRLYISPEQMDSAPARVVPSMARASDPLRPTEDLEESTALELEVDFLSGVPTGSANIRTAVDLLNTVGESQRPIVVLGEPGMGKSVALERLALTYAERFLNEGQGYVPVLVRLRQYHSERRGLHDRIAIAFGRGGLRVDDHHAREILETNRLLILLDGLDEALHDPDVIPEIETFVSEYPQHRVAISCRTKAYQESGGKLEGCDEVRIVPLRPEEAKRLWNSAVQGVEYDALRAEFQEMLRIPLLLRVVPHATTMQEQEPTSKPQLVNGVVKELLRELRPEAGEVAERCLFRVALEMQSSGEYEVSQDRVFDIVSEYLEGNGADFRQRIAEEVVEHPLLAVSDFRVFSFWHPVFQEYFAARGLQDAVLRQGTVQLVLDYLGDYRCRWHDTIVYLAGLLDEEDAAKLTEYVLDFNNHQLALECRLAAKSIRHETAGTVIRQALKDAPEVLLSAVEDSGDGDLNLYLWTRLRDNQGDFDNFESYTVTMTLAILHFQCEARIEPELRRMLKSDQDTELAVALDLVSRLAYLVSFSDQFVELCVEVTKRFHRFSLTAVKLMALRVLSRLASREKDIPHWEKQLTSEDSHWVEQLLAVLVLGEIGDIRALRLLRSALNNTEPSVRLAAVWEMTSRDGQADDLAGMVSDPDPVVAHEAARLLTRYYSDCKEAATWPQTHRFTAHSFKQEFEALVAPLTGRISDKMLLRDFNILNGITGNDLLYLAEPFEYRERLTELLGAVHAQWHWYGQWDWFRRDVGAGPAIAAAIWMVTLADLCDASAKDLVSIYGLPDIEEFLERVKWTSEELTWQHGQVTFDDMSYIRSWTDPEISHEIVHEVSYEIGHDLVFVKTTEVLVGSYKARWRDGE